MTNRKPGQIWAGITGIFLCGAVAGGFIAPRLTHRAVERGRSSSEFVPHVMQRLTDRLELNETQIGQIRPIVDRAWEQLNGLRRQSADVMRAMDKEIEVLLTPEQRARMEEYQSEQRTRWQRLIERREQRAREGEPGGGS